MRASIVALALVAACGSPPSSDAGVDADLDARIDARPDANLAPPDPFTLQIDDGAGRTLEVGTDPLRVRIFGADGETIVEGAGASIEVGLAAGGTERFHSPIPETPGGVRWSALSHGVSHADGTHGVLRDDEGNEAAITLVSDGAGELSLRVEMSGAAVDAALMRVRLHADDASYQGLGEQFDGADARGRVVPMQFSVTTQVRDSSTNEAHVPIPFLVSSHGYGLFVESREVGAFDVAASATDEVRAAFEGSLLDLRFFVDDRPEEVIALYTRHTGLPILPPRWAFAPMHWRNEWADRAELEGDIAAIRSLHIPCTAFWIDNPWETSYNDHVIDETRFPDAAGMLTSMRDQGFRPLVWTTPYLDRPEDGEAADNPAEVLYEQAAARDLLIRLRTGSILSSPSAAGCCEPGGMMDFTSEQAIDFWQDQLDPLIALGVRAFKLDYGEDVVPEIGSGRLGLLFSDGRTPREVHNVYATLYHLPYRHAIDEGAAEGGFLLARAEAWGGQTVTDIIWPGDLDNDFSVGGDRIVGGMQAAISAMISLAASGFPAFGSDTGGYRGGMPDRELLLRWAEHTAFSPILQLGGAGDHHNPWLYDAEAGLIYAGLARAHMDLVPYFRVLAIRAHTDGTPPLLHPALAYPDDRAGYADPNAYLLGPDVFVAPVVTAGATTRAVHLPPGRWVHWFTGVEVSGDVVVDAPLGAPPAFLRVGAIVPLGPADLDTLVESTAYVSPSDRPFLRARILPAGDRSVVAEEGITLHVTHTSAPLTITVTPSTGLTDLRMQIDLDHAEPPIDPSSVTTLSVAGVAVPPAPDRATVEAGCDGACWARDGATLYVSVRSAAESRITVP
jgi:alpha-D-xyloside xylohydrolase